MPWGNIPKHREGTFIAPMYPHGGLLGGAGTPGKPSKLQQLALARKKKAEEQKAGNMDQNVQGTATQLSQLSVAQDLGDNEAGNPLSITGPFSPDSTPSSKKPGLGTLLTDRKRKVADLGQVEIPPVAKPSPESSITTPNEDPAPEPATPSAFAQTLFGSAPAAPKSLPETSYQLPYMAFTSSVSEAFSGPSPDDVILSAQAKGSLLGTRKTDEQRN